jgi:hypothetical protein
MGLLIFGGFGYMSVGGKDEIIETLDTGIDSKSDALTSVFGRSHVQKMVKKILLENAFRKGEWVTFEGRPITNLELVIRELLESRAWQAKVAAIELGFGKAPQVSKVEGGLEVTFKVEHDDSWMEAPTADEDSIEAEFSVGA